MRRLGWLAGVAALVGCGGDGRTADAGPDRVASDRPPAEVGVDRSARDEGTEDASGCPTVLFRWSIERGGAPATCEQVGGAEVRVDVLFTDPTTGMPRTISETGPCAAGEHCLEEDRFEFRVPVPVEAKLLDGGGDQVALATTTPPSMAPGDVVDVTFQVAAGR